MFYTDLPRTRSVSSLQITKMVFDDEEQEILREKRTPELVNGESRVKISDPTAVRPKSARKKPTKQSKLKRQRKHIAVIEKEPVVEMKLEGKKTEKLQKKPSLNVHTEDWPDWSPRSRELSPCKSFLEDKPSDQRLKPGMMSPGITRLLSTLSGKLSEGKIGSAQRRKQTREKVPETPVPSSKLFNTIRMQVSDAASSSFVCGGGLPDDQSYLAVTAQQFL